MKCFGPEIKEIRHCVYYVWKMWKLSTVPTITTSKIGVAQAQGHFMYLQAKVYLFIRYTFIFILLVNDTTV